MATIKTQQLTENFNINEFACKDGTPVPDELECNVVLLASQLQRPKEKVKIYFPVHCYQQRREGNY